MVIMNGDELIKYFKLKSNSDKYGCEEKLELIDEDGYKYFLSIANLRCLFKRDGIPCKFFNNNPFTKENIETYISENIGDHIKIIDFMNAKNAKDEFIVRCEKHDITYKRYWNIIKNGQFCNECGLEKYKNSRKNSLDDIKSIGINKYDITITSNTYINNLEPLSFICNKHKDAGVQFRSWANIISTKHSCKICASESIGESSRLTHDEFLQKIPSDCKVEIIGTYTGAHDKIEVKCKSCGEIFYLRSDHITRGVGCAKCIKSQGENLIESILNNMNIKAMTQYRFKECRHIKPLPFDFYLPNMNICIEYDGIQHYESIDFFGGEDEFSLVKLRDSIKNTYCKDNNIKLIRIPYFEYDNIEEILNKEIFKRS